MCIGKIDGDMVLLARVSINIGATISIIFFYSHSYLFFSHTLVSFPTNLYSFHRGGFFFPPRWKETFSTVERNFPRGGKNKRSQ